MGTRTLEEWWADIQDAAQRPSLNTAKITRWVNLAMKEFGYAFQFAELEAQGTLSTLNGTETYLLTDLASDYRKLQDTGFHKFSPATRLGKLKRETREQWKLRRGDGLLPTNWGNPVWYHRHGMSIYLRPIPDSTTTLILFDYWKKLTEISVAGDVSPFSDDWDDIIFTGALYRAFRAQGAHDRYINIRNDFIGMIRSRAMDEDLEEFPQGGLNIISDDSELETGTDA